MIYPDFTYEYYFIALTLSKADSIINCCSFQNTSQKHSAAILETYIWFFFLPFLKDRLLQTCKAFLNMKKSTWFLEDPDFVLDFHVRLKNGSFLVTFLCL